MKILALILSVCMILVLSGCVSPAMKHAKQGDAYFEQGQWDNAISEYSAALELEPSLELDPSIVLGPKLARAYASRATAYYEGGNYDAAIADFQNAARKDPKIEVGPKLVEAYKARAALHNKNGEYDMAIADADMAVKHNSRDATALYLRGTAYIGKKSWDLAIADLSIAIGIDKNVDTDLQLAEAYLQRAALFYAKGLKTDGAAYIDRVISYCNEAVQRNPNSAVAYRRLGSAYLLLQKSDTAMSNLNKAIEIEPNSSEAYVLRGSANSLKGDTDAAIADLDKAIMLDPQNARAYSTRGAIHAQQSKFDLAIADLSKAIELSPQVALYHNRAMVYWAKALKAPSKQEAAPLLEQAISDWTKAIDGDPSLFQPYFYRGIVYFETELWDLATADLKKAIELSNDPEKTKIAEFLLNEIASKQGK